jgi:hypothetical protein
VSSDEPPRDAVAGKCLKVKHKNIPSGTCSNTDGLKSRVELQGIAFLQYQ